ncbi:MAG: GNAT family N-acetyltransferase [Clostridiaceae bacterium]
MINKELFLRKANLEDCDLIYEYANDKEVRNNSFNSGTISYDTHVNWFKNKLNDKNNLFFILTDGYASYGQIRLDISNNEGLISYSIAKEHRGHGLGKKIMLLIEDYIKENKVDINIIIAKVKPNNLASKKVFEALGYVTEQLEEYLQFTKKL